MKKPSPTAIAARAGLRATGKATLAALTIFVFFFVVRLNSELAELISGHDRGYGVASLYLAICGLEVVLAVGIYSAIKAYREARDE